MAMELLFLGTGTSAGVPMIGCPCAVCRSEDPRDRRTRPSILLRYDDPQGAPRQLLVDSGPDLRSQALRHGLERLDAVLYTHAHADHIFGIDDLRRFNAVMETALDIYTEQETLERLQAMFPYVFGGQRDAQKTFVPTLRPHCVEPDTPWTLHGTTVRALRLMHGRLPILGFRFDQGDRALAYCSDVSTIPPESRAALKDLDVLVLDALRYRHHPTHFTVDQALETIAELRPKRAYLTHIAHDIRHAELEARLPEGVTPAHDELAVTV
jgi:phosphoribosyl 1,2-cyclic phosphate phosphodiesterase